MLCAFAINLIAACAYPTGYQRYKWLLKLLLLSKFLLSIWLGDLARLECFLAGLMG